MNQKGVFMLKISLAACAGLALFATAHAETRYEAENQSLPESATVIDSSACSGGKCVNANGLSFIVSAEQAGIYDLTIPVSVRQYDWFNTSISVNGKQLSSTLTNSPDSAYTHYTLKASAKFNVGENTVQVSGGQLNIDYLEVDPHPEIVFSLDAKPVTPGATESAYKLKNFLTENFGKKTLSGMMIGDNAFNYHYGATLEDSYLITSCVPSDSCSVSDEKTTWKGQEDISEFYKRSGHYPALGGFDMLFATGGHSDEGWFSGYTDNNIRMARELWNMGGVPAFTWHWKVGTDTVFYTKSQGFKNESCTDGVIASSSDNTCFNYTKAFSGDKCEEVNTASETYQLIMADVDKISKRFLDLQDSGVAILWRPLHEAAGGWFWWGVAGPDCYKQLYKLVYDRMVNVNGVKNALWIWNIERDPQLGYDYNALNPEWYPGDDYVDIVGVDIYNNSGDNQSNVNYYNKIIDEIGSHKILALTENGPIPDVDSTFDDNAVWSFWMPWYNTWSSGFLNQTDNSVWQKNLSDSRILSLESMPGWENVSVKLAPKNHKQSVQIVQRGKTLQFTLQKASRVSLYSLSGKRILTIGENLSAGTHTANLSKLSQGIYLVRIQNRSGTQQQKILVP